MMLTTICTCTRYVHRGNIGCKDIMILVSWLIVCGFNPSDYFCIRIIRIRDKTFILPYVFPSSFISRLNWNIKKALLIKLTDLFINQAIWHAYLFLDSNIFKYYAYMYICKFKDNHLSCACNLNQLFAQIICRRVNHVYLNNCRHFYKETTLIKRQSISRSQCRPLNLLSQLQ